MHTDSIVFSFQPIKGLIEDLNQFEEDLNFMNYSQPIIKKLEQN